MGLLLENYSLSSGLVSTQAYVRIDTISGNKEKMIVDLKIYVTQEASKMNIPYIDKKLVEFVPNTDDIALNYHKQAYEHMKTLPVFINAVDVLEEGQTA